MKTPKPFTGNAEFLVPDSTTLAIISAILALQVRYTKRSGVAVSGTLARRGIPTSIRRRSAPRNA